MAQVDVEKTIVRLSFETQVQDITGVIRMFVFYPNIFGRYGDIKRIKSASSKLIKLSLDIFISCADGRMNLGLVQHFIILYPPPTLKTFIFGSPQLVKVGKVRYGKQQK